eukprot:4389752-Pleurochrysis_carterae.AAC.7
MKATSLVPHEAKDCISSRRTKDARLRFLRAVFVAQAVGARVAARDVRRFRKGAGERDGVSA